MSSHDGGVKDIRTQKGHKSTIAVLLLSENDASDTLGKLPAGVGHITLHSTKTALGLILRKTINKLSIKMTGVHGLEGGVSVPECGYQ